MEEKISLIHRDYVIAHKNDDIYISNKKDKIDTTLGAYVNLYNQKPENDKLKIMFLRESEGVY